MIEKKQIHIPSNPKHLKSQLDQSIDFVLAYWDMTYMKDQPNFVGITIIIIIHSRKYFRNCA